MEKGINGLSAVGHDFPCRFPHRPAGGFRFGRYAGIDLGPGIIGNVVARGTVAILMVHGIGPGCHRLGFQGIGLPGRHRFRRHHALQVQFHRHCIHYGDTAAPGRRDELHLSPVSVALHRKGRGAVSCGEVHLVPCFFAIQKDGISASGNRKPRAISIFPYHLSCRFRFEICKARNSHLAGSKKPYLHIRTQAGCMVFISFRRRR